MHRILIVDDDTDLLSSFRRQLRKHFEVVTAENGEKGLEKLCEGEGIAIAISDYRMPGMDGLAFLREVAERSPDTVRMLLTGYADLNVAIEAVNESNIFRLLTKPCPAKTLGKALSDALKAYKAAKAEKELLQKTVTGAVQILTDTASLVKPELHGRVTRIIPYVREMSRLLRDDAPWMTEMAANLSILGYMALPEKLLQKVDSGTRLTDKEQARYAAHAAYSAKQVSAIPRMEKVAEILSLTEKRFDGSGPPEDGPRALGIPLASRILKVCADFDILLSSGRSKAEALKVMRQRKGWYDPQCVAALADVLGEEARCYVREVYPLGLEAGMVLIQDVIGVADGKKVKVLSKGQELSQTMIDYLYKNAEHLLDITEPIRVRECMTTFAEVEEGGGNEDEQACKIGGNE